MAPRPTRCLAAVALSWAAAGATVESQKGCHWLEAQCCHIDPSRDPSYDAYRADPEHQVPGWELVDLSVPAALRWDHVVRPRADKIRTMIETFKQLLGKVSQELFKLVEDTALFRRVTAEVLDAWGEYGEELRGIAKSTGIAEGELLVYNLMYELTGGCTSIVAEGADGVPVHGRNLDFGQLYLWQLFGVDWKHLQWMLTEVLRPLLVNVRYVRGPEVLFNSTVFAGYLGLLTGNKEGSFAITVNTRNDDEHLKPLIAYLRGQDRSGHFLSFMTRNVMTNNGTYEEGLDTIRNSRLLGPAYVTISGVKSGQGAIVARTARTIAEEWLLEDAKKSGSNFIVVSNYDGEQDPWYDNRRSPAQHCLKERFGSGVDLRDLFEVLSAHPNRNRLTTYTTLMQAQTGKFEAYLQYCEELTCAPWLSEIGRDVVV